MPSDEDIVRLRHMLEAAREAVEFAEGKARADLDSDRKLALALRQLIEDVGEASKQVSFEVQETRPEIPWSRLARTRDRLIHRYHDINFDIIWRIVTEDLPEVIAALERILEPEEGE